MTRSAYPLALAMALIALSGCNPAEQAGGNSAAGIEAVKKAGDTTIASGLDQKGRFAQATKAAGLDATLAGPGPYTVLVPDDAAFAKLPAGTADNWLKPESRTELTKVLTYHILPGTVLAEDIGKAIDNGNGKAVLATMGGETLTATREGGKIILTDGTGAKATVTTADQTRTNGVVHQVDAVLRPGEASA